MKIIVCVFVVCIILMVVLITSSCAIFRANKYNVAFRNVGKQNLFVTTSKIGNYTPPVGILISGAYSGSGGHIGIPGSVMIKIKKDNGITIEKEINVRKNLPSRFGNNDTIVFNINDNDEVILSFERFGSEEIDSDGNPFHLGKKKSKAAVE